MTIAEQLERRGAQRAKKENSRLIARRLLSMEKKPDFISQATGLTEEEIACLADENDKVER